MTDVTSGNDRIVGHLSQDDTILGLGGDDTLKGGEGQDAINGGTGVDGDDLIVAGEATTISPAATIC